MFNWVDFIFFGNYIALSNPIKQSKDRVVETNMKVIQTDHFSIRSRRLFGYDQGGGGDRFNKRM